MDILQQVLLLIVVFLGGPVGVILSYVAREELAPGKRYFFVLKRAVFLAIIFLTFLYSGLVTLAVIATLLLALILYFYKHRLIEYLLYAVLAVIYPIALSNAALILIASVLTFFYGFPKASLFVLRYGHAKLPTLLKTFLQKNYYFLIIALAILVIRLLV